MSIRRRIFLITAAAVLAAAGLGTVAFLGGASDVWDRKAPLIDAIPVVSVHEGVLTLADGRSFRPAGISRREPVSQSELDRAIRAITAQGVTVTRDLGDGRAFLLAEPKFYNPSGTRAYYRNRWLYWAGKYVECPLSELLIQTAFADPALTEPDLTPREIWRLQGAQSLAYPDSARTRISTDGGALRHDSHMCGIFEDYEWYLDAAWKPPPP